MNDINGGLQRTLKARKHIYYMFLLKFVSIAVNFAYVPLLIHSLNDEKYGIWLTITSITAWISFFDIGLGNGLRNKLSESISLNNDKLAREYISTTYITSAFICFSFIIIVLIITPLMNWNKILNTHLISNSELCKVILVVLVSMGLQLFFKLINSIFYAFQLPAMATVILTTNQFISFVFVFLYTIFFKNLTLFTLAIIVSLIPIMVFCSYSLIFFNRRFRKYIPSIKYFDKHKIYSVVVLGLKFFWIQFTALVLFQSNNFIITQVCGNADVTIYNVSYKYMGITEMLFSIIITPYWSAVTEAYTKGDYQWIKNILRKLTKIAFLIIVLGLFLIINSTWIFKLWLHSSITPNVIILGTLLLYFNTQLFWMLYGNIINGIGFIRLQLYVTLVEALVHIPLAIVLGHFIGVEGVVLSLFICTFPNLFWPKVQVGKILNGCKSGIWVK